LRRSPFGALQSAYGSHGCPGHRRGTTDADLGVEDIEVDAVMLGQRRQLRPEVSVTEQDRLDEV